jgi:hypothetical protein
MRHILRTALSLAAVIPPLVIGLGGCATTAPETASVTYPDGRYQLYGDGTTARPYYWAWIPNGTATVTVPRAPPPVPARTAAVVTAPATPTTTVVVPPSSTTSTVVVPTPSTTPTVVTATGGRYQLYGDGASTPYYWVWVPTGASPPPPPPLPSR